MHFSFGGFSGRRFLLQERPERDVGAPWVSKWASLHFVGVGTSMANGDCVNSCLMNGYTCVLHCLVLPPPFLASGSSVPVNDNHTQRSACVLWGPMDSAHSVLGFLGSC